MMYYDVAEGDLVTERVEHNVDRAAARVVDTALHHQMEPNRPLLEHVPREQGHYVQDVNQEYLAWVHESRQEEE